MPNKRTPVIWFDGGPLHGKELHKTALGRWPVYLEPTLDRDGAVRPLRTSEGDARARRRAEGDPVTFYKLDGEQETHNGRTGRRYVFCTLLEERARRKRRKENPVAAVVELDELRAAVPATAPVFVAPEV